MQWASRLGSVESGLGAPRAESLAFWFLCARMSAFLFRNQRGYRGWSTTELIAD